MGAQAASTLSDLIRRMLGDPEASWSLGIFGAIAEFHHVEGDPLPHVQPIAGGGEVVTSRGAVRVRVEPRTRAVAHEGLSRRRDSWTQSVSFCLPQDIAAMAGRSVLTDLGRDREAARPEDRTAILFDIGIGAPHVDFCIRTSDPTLIHLLRKGCGTSLLGDANPQITAIKQSSPDRVCLSRLGRIEVFQPIGSRQQKRLSPVGPHTHLLPALLDSQRDADTGSMIPEGWCSALDLYPGHPLRDRVGRDRPFDLALHTEFQELLERYAPPGYMEEKLLVAAAVVAGMDPHLFPGDAAAPGCRTRHIARQISLRQMLHTHPEVSAVRTWLAEQNDLLPPHDLDIAH